MTYPIPTPYGCITQSTATHVTRLVHRDGQVVVQTFTHPVETLLDAVTATAALDLHASLAGTDPYLEKLARTDDAIDVGTWRALPTTQEGC